MQIKIIKLLALFFIIALAAITILYREKVLLFGGIQGLLALDGLEGLLVNELKKPDNAVGLLVLLAAGLTDGINPCALSMLFFFLIFILSNKAEKSNVLIVGFLFAAGSFVSYFLMGLGLIQAIRYARYIKFLNIAILAVASLAAFVLAYLNILDAINARKNKIKNIVLKLPSGNKEFIHNLIKRAVQFKFKYFVSFAGGFLVTLSELLCTGQIYLITIISLQRYDDFSKMFYLTVFNIGFVTPVIILGILVYKGKEIMSMSDILLTKMWIIKLITALMMMILGSYSLMNLLSAI